MMAAPAPETSLIERAGENRRFQRVKVVLLGRYMLENQREFPCQVRAMSPGEALIRCPVIGRIGERVIAYIDHIGRIEGRIASTGEEEFVMEIEATARKRDRLADQLTWLANRYVLGLPEGRRHARFTPRDPYSTLTLPDGASLPCKVLDMSLSGAAVAIKIRPPVGTVVSLGRIRGHVVRHFDDGLAIDFAAVQDPDEIENAI